MMADDDGPPTLRQKRRTERGHREGRQSQPVLAQGKGTILHAVAYQTIVRQDTPWTLQQPFTRYVNGYNQLQR